VDHIFRLFYAIKSILAHRSARSMIGDWHDNVIYPSVCLCRWVLWWISL